MIAIIISYMELNSTRKREKYKALVDRLKKSYDDVVYAKISMCACGFIEKDSKKFLDIMTKLINICIRTSYFIFVAEIKNGPSPNFHPFKK